MATADDLPRIAYAMRIDIAAARALTAIAGAGVDCILLKGSSHMFLAEPGETRMYVDVDVLVAPRQEAAAMGVLRSLGYRELLEGAVATERNDYGSTWVKDAEPAVDLHTTMPLTRRPPEEVWRILRADAVAHEVAGGRYLALSRRASLLHVALHAAKSGPFVASPAWDLTRALRLDRSEWIGVRALAVDLDALEPLSAGLRALPQGVALADELDLPREFSLSLELRSASASPPATSIGRFLSTGGVGPRLRLLRNTLAPSATSLRLSTRLARRGRAGLVAAYALRPFAVTFRLPRALREVWAARQRRQVRRRSLGRFDDGAGSGS